MGWGHAQNNEGREVGYGVRAVCDEPGCGEAIDRGLHYVCGGMHDGTSLRTGEQIGCGGYFCGDHLGYYFRDVRPGEPLHPDRLVRDGQEMSDQLCSRCGTAWRERRELELA